MIMLIVKPIVFMPTQNQTKEVFDNLIIYYTIHKYR